MNHKRGKVAELMAVIQIYRFEPIQHLPCTAVEGGAQGLLF